MPVFTAAAAFIAGAVGITSTFITGAIAFGLQAAASIGLSYAAKALAGNTDTPSSANDHFSAQGTLQAGGDIPRAFNLGYSMTAGSLVYANTWGIDGETPNAYFTQVIALADLPGGDLVEVWVNGELCTVEWGTVTAQGSPVLEYRKDGKDHVWIKYYDGTQTAADSFLQTQVASADRPWGLTRVGYGVAHAICTALVEDTLFSGFPTYKFAMSGLPLYDISKDSTAGGSGAHLWSDPSTWGGDGDDLPAVQIYNILRGVSYDSVWLYGLQSMTAPRLPAANWIAQVNKCREAILNESGGFEPTYRSGLQINVNTQPANAIETLLTACQGRVSEIGGFYKIHLGAPEGPTFEFTDADILSTEAQTFTPFFPLADSINGITASYPNPAEGWNTKAAPAIFRDDYEARDGNRRLLANPSFDAVPYSEQVQRLMKSALDEAQRARRHALVMPPAFWLVEPGDIVEWTSARNGYEEKIFRVDGVVDEPNLDVSWNITEVDPSDYDWDPGEYQPVVTGPTIFPRPSPQGIVDWFAEPWIIKDDSGLNRRPAIRLSWDGDMPGVDGVAFAIRNKSDHEVVHRGRTDYLDAGAIIISQSLLPNFEYQAQGKYIPSAPRDVIPSDWMDVTTPNVLLGFADFDESVVNAVTGVFDPVSAALSDLDQRISRLVMQALSRSQIDKKELRTQLFATAGTARAEIDEVRTVAVDAATAVANLDTTVSAEFDDVNATVTEHTTTIATLDGYAAGTWGVSIDVDGNVTGIVLANDSENFSVFSVTADNFRVAFPGHAGGAAIPVFQISNVGGVAKIVFRGDMIGDGSITTQTIAAGAITTVTLAAQAVTAAKVAANSITAANGAIEDLAVKTFKIGDNAVTVPAVQTRTDQIISNGSYQTVSSLTFNVDTTGIGGKTVTVLITFNASISIDPGATINARLVVNSNVLQTTTTSAMTVLPFMSSYQFTASGGVDSISIQVDVSAGVNPWAYVQSRTLSAMTAKR
jgi:hypothetical protein